MCCNDQDLEATAESGLDVYGHRIFDYSSEKNVEQKGLFSRMSGD